MAITTTYRPDLQYRTLRDTASLAALEARHDRPSVRYRGGRRVFYRSHEVTLGTDRTWKVTRRHRSGGVEYAYGMRSLAAALSYIDEGSA